MSETQNKHRCDGEVWQHNWQDDYYGTTCADCGLFFAYGCAPWDDTDCDEDDDPLFDDEEYDELEDALGNCHAFLDGGVYVCGAAGSEECDECPFYNDLGTSPNREI